METKRGQAGAFFRIKILQLPINVHHREDDTVKLAVREHKTQHITCKPPLKFYACKYVGIRQELRGTQLSAVTLHH